MKRTQLWRILWGAGLMIVLLLAGPVALAGSPGQQDPFPPGGWGGPVAPLEPPEVRGPAQGEPGGVGPASLQAVQSATAAMMNYQGLLTDAGGTPLNGTYTLKFGLYTEASAGSSVWGPETHAGVVVSKGLFQVTLGSSLPFSPDVFTQQLYLQTTVGTTVLPRQPLHATPYAMGLVLGSGTSGSTPTEFQYGFSVSNDGGWGIYANAKGDGSTAIFSADVIYSDEGYSGPPTYVWVPGTALEMHALDTAWGHIEHYFHGLVRMNSDASGASVDVMLPVQLERPYGRNYRLTEVKLYYRVGAPSYIAGVDVEGQDFNVNSYPDAAVSTATGSSTAYAVYTIPVDPPFEISDYKSVTDLHLNINTGTPNGQDGYVDIFGARLRLVSAY